MPRDARFCPECGTPADGGTTVKADLPREEPAAGPVSISHVEPHWFGVAPPTLLLGVAGVVLAVAVVLFVSGSWPFGLILVGLGALLLACFLELARRRPYSPVTRVSADARERAGSALETWRARVAVTAEVRRLRSALAVIEAERRTALSELGAAVHRGDGSAEAGTRAHLADLDEREAQLHAELDQRLAHADERIRQTRLAVDDTMMVTPNQPSEPYPPPGEATPPQPAVVPEPYPPPDEGTPPEPAPQQDDE